MKCLIKYRNRKYTFRSAILLSAALLVTGIAAPGFDAIYAQGPLRQIRQKNRQNRLKRQLERETKNNAEAATAEEAEGPGNFLFNVRPTNHSLDGIQQKGVVQFFSLEERSLAIPGFGRTPAYLVILRQLDLTKEQKGAIRMIRRRVGNRLNQLRQESNRLEQQLEEAIYGEDFEPARVNELSRSLGEKQVQITVLQANIESQFRQILTPDQFYVFRFLVGEMLLPQRRMSPNQLRQQNQRRRAQPE